jgi:hypothetical protein
MELETDPALIAAAKRTAEELVNHLLGLTVNLVRFKDPATRADIEGIASGFFVLRNGAYLLISAGHALKKGPWFWEPDIDLSELRQALLCPVGGFMLYDAFTFDASGEVKPEAPMGGGLRKVDFGWCTFDLDGVTRQFQADPQLAGKSMSVPHFKGPLNAEPKVGETYAFAARSRVTVEPAGVNFVWRDNSYDFLEFIGTNEAGHHVFRSVDGHKGSAYYEGASGSPIAGPQDGIVSMLIGGHPGKDEIYGFALSRFEHLIGFDLTVPTA